MFWKCRILRQQFLDREISTSYMWYSGAFPQSHARSAFCSDWWINCCVWRWGNCRCVSKGIKTALGRDGWPPTIPTTAPPRQLPTGWWSNLGNASCTACDLGVSASWLCARSGHHGGMWGKRWHTTWATVEQATKSEFSRCKWNHAPLCGSLQRKSQMCPSPARSWCQQRPSRDKPWINASFHSSSPWAPWSCQISGGVGCQQRPRPEKWWINASTRSSSSGAPWSCPISGWVGCQQRPRHDKPWINASFHGSWGGAPWSCPISGGGGCQQRPSPDRRWSNASFRCRSSGAPWSCPIFGWVGCQQRARPDRDWLNSYFRSS